MQLYFDECVVNKYTVSVCVCCLTCGRCSVLPAALNLQVDGVGVVGKQQTGDQSKHLGGKKKKKKIYINIRFTCDFTVTWRQMWNSQVAQLK